MGLIGLQSICEKLIEYGRDPSTPVAIIEKGTTQTQRVVIATLATTAEKAKENAVNAPTLTIVGDVVLLHEKLKWR